MQRSLFKTLVTLHTTKLSLYAGSYTVKLTGSSLFSLSILRAQMFTQFSCFFCLFVLSFVLQSSVLSFPFLFFFFVSTSVWVCFFHNFSRYFVSLFLCLLFFILFLSILLCIILSLCSVLFVPCDVLIFAFVIYLFSVFVYIDLLPFLLFFISLDIPFCFSFSFISLVLSPTGNHDWKDHYIK